MVISSEFRMRQYRNDDHREDALHFKIKDVNQTIIQSESFVT